MTAVVRLKKLDRLFWRRCATCTSPTLSYDTDRSRCQPALPRSDCASRSRMARLSLDRSRCQPALPRSDCASRSMMVPSSTSGRRQQADFARFARLLVAAIFHRDDVCRLAACALVQIDVEKQVLVASGLDDSRAEERLSGDGQSAHQRVRFVVLVLPAIPLTNHNRDGRDLVLAALNELELAVLFWSVRSFCPLRGHAPER